MKRRGFTLIELMIVVAIIGILAAIAIPNFIRFQARSKQGEAKANLKSLFTAERSLYQEKDKYYSTIRDIGFAPERGNRYAYFVGGGTCENRAVSPATTAPADSCITVDVFKFTSAGAVAVGTNAGAPAWTSANKPPTANPGGVLPATCPACEFSGFASGNIDNETVGIDQWYIGSVDSTNVPFNSAAENVPAGQPQNAYNDVVNDT